MIAACSSAPFRAPAPPLGTILDLGRSRVSELPAMTLFHRWRGRSGQRYLASVHAPEALEPSENSVALLVAVDNGERHICGTVSFGALDAGAMPRLRRAIATSDADEVHVHLLALTEADRAAMVRDLAPMRRRGPLSAI